MPSPVVLDEPSIEAAQLNVVPEPTPAAEPRKWKFRSTFLLAGAVFWQ